MISPNPQYAAVTVAAARRLGRRRRRRRPHSQHLVLSPISVPTRVSLPSAIRSLIRLRPRPSHSTYTHHENVPARFSRPRGARDSTRAVQPRPRCARLGSRKCRGRDDPRGACGRCARASCSPPACGGLGWAPPPAPPRRRERGARDGERHRVCCWRGNRIRCGRHCEHGVSAIRAATNDDHCDLLSGTATRRLRRASPVGSACARLLRRASGIRDQ